MSDKKAAIYMRVSTLGQAESGFGRDVQLERCEAMITAKGWELTGTFEDNGKSGTTTRGRTGLRKMMKAARAGEVNVVVIAELSRLGRSTRDVLRIAEELNGLDVGLVSVTESIDTTSPTGKFVFTIFAAVAEMDSALLVERLGRGRAKRREYDLVSGNSVPFGYQMVKGSKPAEVTIIPDEAADLQVLFILRQQQDYTLRAVADHLNEFGSAGRNWYASTVRNALKHEDRYRGGNEFWPAILEVDNEQT